MKAISTLLFTLIFTLSGFTNNEIRPIEASFLQNLSVYPNPSSSGKYTISFSALAQQETITIKVVNLIGREIYKKVITIHQGLYEDSIHLNSVPKGIYLLIISNGDQKQIKRLSFI